MIPLNKTEHRALQTLAQHLGATQAGDILTLGGRIITVDIDTAPTTKTSKARFRDDKVARRFLGDLEAAVQTRAPEGRTAIVTLGAPIKVANQALAALTDVLVGRLTDGPTDVDEPMDILGNRVRLHVLSDNAIWTAKAVAFVFTGDPSPGDLARTFAALHARITARARAAERTDGPRWLILTGGEMIADIKTYRRAFARMVAVGGFEKVWMAVGGGRVEALI